MTVETHIWSSENLLAKARVYVQRAEQEDAGTSLEALWCLLAFEFLARAAIARVHPALLADPQTGPHLLYGFGFGNPQSPRSITTHTVLARCQTIVPEFTAEDVKEAGALVNMRNAELHSGSTVLEELATSRWMPQFYRLTKLLLRHLEVGLDEFFSDDRAALAERVIADLDEAAEGDVKQRIADRSRAFGDLDAVEQEKRRRLGTAEGALEPSWMRVVACPACGTRFPIRGEVSDFSQPRVGDDEIELSATVLPTGFTCAACELELRSHGEMLHAGLGDQYSITQSEDPIDFYGIDPVDRVSAEDFFEPDYGND